MTHSDKYLPAPQSCAAYVAALLHSLPIGAEVDTGTISHAIDLGIPNIISGSGPLVSHGLVIREKVGARYLWRRGPTQLLDAFIAEHAPKHKIDVDPTLRATLTANAKATASVEDGTLSLADRFAAPRVLPDDLGTSIVLAARDGLAAAALEPTADIVDAGKTKNRVRATPAAALRCGLFSDGALSIERGGKVEVYDADEVTILVRFLDRMLLRNGSVQA